MKPERYHERAERDRVGEDTGINWSENRSGEGGEPAGTRHQRTVRYGSVRNGMRLGMPQYGSCLREFLCRLGCQTLESQEHHILLGLHCPGETLMLVCTYPIHGSVSASKLSTSPCLSSVG